MPKIEAILRNKFKKSIAKNENEAKIWYWDYFKRNRNIKFDNIFIYTNDEVYRF